MPPTGRWILIVAGLASAAIALLGAVTYPGTTKDLGTTILYEVALFAGIFIVLGLAYKQGYTEREISVQ